METTQLLMISALQHVAYCPRQFALIHVEQVWAENFFTAHGQLLHQRVDSGEVEQRGRVRYERSVSVLSERLGITGKLDLLEIEGKSDEGNVCYFPVEYKRGKHKTQDWDRIQLCAQALCLEDMRSVSVTEGALWYQQERKREQVVFDASLRELTLSMIEQARVILDSRTTPAPTSDKSRCKACSLVELCLPDMVRNDKSKAYVQHLFEASFEVSDEDIE